MEKDNHNRPLRGDGSAAAETKKAVEKARAAIVETLTAEQNAMTKGSADWVTLENMKEDVLRETDPKILGGMLTFLANLLETLSTEKLIEETHK